jgi:hypothetical protein
VILTLFSAKNEPAFLADLVTAGRFLKSVFLLIVQTILAAAETATSWTDAVVIHYLAIILFFWVAIIIAVVIGVFSFTHLYLGYTSYCADSYTVFFMLTALAVCIFGSSWISPHINVVLLYLIANAVFILVRRHRQWKALRLVTTIHEEL